MDAMLALVLLLVAALLWKEFMWLSVACLFGVYWFGRRATAAQYSGVEATLFILGVGGVVAVILRFVIERSH